MQGVSPALATRHRQLASVQEPVEGITLTKNPSRLAAGVGEEPRCAVIMRPATEAVLDLKSS
jgi:hypothetical protein